MSGLACNFCAHANPEGSTFCNRCGSPLHLKLCYQCEAINSVLAAECFQCGAPLSSASTEEMATAAVAAMETAQVTATASTRVDPVPIALAGSEEALTGAEHLLAQEARPTFEHRPSPEEVTVDRVSHGDERAPRSPYVGRNTSAADHPNRALGFFLVALVAVAAGALYWMYVNETHPPDPRTVAGAGSTTAPEPVPSAPGVPPETAVTRTESPSGAALPSSAAPLESPATAGESTAPSAKGEPSTTGSSESPAVTSAPANLQPPAAQRATSPPADVQPQVTERTPANRDAQNRVARVPSPTAGAVSADGATAETSKARATNDTRRQVTQARTKEQAERDAIATQRLIAREFAESPPADSAVAPPPRP